MFRFFRIERPTTVILRPHSIATSAACCIRWMLEAKLATRIRPATQGKERAEGLADEALGAGRAGTLGVRRVSEEKVDAAVPNLGELADVGAQAVDRRVVELPVAGVDDASGPCLEHERDRVRDRMRDADQLEPERAELERLVLRPRLEELRGLADAVLVELRLDQPERQARGDDRLRPRPRGADTEGRRRGPRARA